MGNSLTGSSLTGSGLGRVGQKDLLGGLVGGETPGQLISLGIFDLPAFRTPPPPKEYYK